MFAVPQRVYIYILSCTARTVIKNEKNKLAGPRYIDVNELCARPEPVPRVLVRVNLWVCIRYGSDVKIASDERQVSGASVSSELFSRRSVIGGSRFACEQSRRALSIEHNRPAGRGIWRREWFFRYASM